MNNSKKSLRITFISIIFLWAVTACYFEESRSSISLPYNQYNIDPGNILESISLGEKNIFTPLATPPSLSEFQSAPIDWKQSDYLTIANSLHEFIWGESLNNWKLNLVDFSKDCDKTSYGFQYARFIFFKITNNANGGYRVAHTMFIELNSKSVGVSASKYSPLVMTWDEVDLSQLEISSDEAFQIAEINGGSNSRESVNNNCSISVSFNTTLPKKGNWSVSYYTEEEILNIEVDPVTGEYR